MLSFAEAYKIAAEVHKNQTDKAGGPYIDFLQNVADYLKNKGEPEEVQTLAILQDLTTGGTKKSAEEIVQGFGPHCIGQRTYVVLPFLKQIHQPSITFLSWSRVTDSKLSITRSALDKSCLVGFVGF